MDSSLYIKPQRYQFTIFFMIVLVTLGRYSIPLGFSLKPYMIFLLLFIFIHLSSFYFQRLQSFEVAMLLFYFFYCYSGAFALHPESSLRIIFGITLYLTCYFIMKSILSYSNSKVIEKGISNAGIIFNAASLIFYILGVRSASVEMDSGRIIDYGVMVDRNYPRLIGLLEDPNFFVFYNTIFFAYYLCHQHNWKNRLGLILCIAANLLTLSRGGFVALVIMFAVYLVLNKPYKQMKILVGSVLSLSLLAYIVIVQLKFDMLGMINSRFEDFSTDGGSGRFELWGRAWSFFSDNMIFGIGAFNFSDYNLFRHNDTLTVHNTFLDILSESGLVGISFFLIFIFLIFIQLWKFNVHREKQYLFLTYIGFVIQMMFLSVIINDMFFVYLAILSTYLHSIQQEKYNKKQLETYPILKKLIS
ncbi:O-antigen ligase family protein [Sutcliffiella deserti]|uniref:O-antigen ligase family protein n=1 Tax=Sutcliffiella deserti TaxID=2875501 RepID=UPI001CBCB3CD|nr:O-antigen ligase family protein [Sutcliffiella deserti]